MKKVFLTSILLALQLFNAFETKAQSTSHQGILQSTSERNSRSALSGTYTIGSSSADFLTISQAIDSLTALGVSGPVVFNIKPGTYTGHYTIPAIQGSSPTNTITFQPEDGDTSSVKLEYCPSTTDDNYIFLLDGAKDITFRLLTFNFCSTSASCGAFVIRNKANRNKIIGNIFNGQQSAQTNLGYQSVIWLYFGQTEPCDSNIISHNRIKGGAYGINFSNHLVPTNERCFSNEITSNIFENQGVTSVFALNQSFLKISNNSISTQLTNDSINLNGGIYCTGIWLFNSDSAKILSNQINVYSKFNTSVGVFLNGGDNNEIYPEAPHSNMIANNMISVASPVGAEGLAIGTRNTLIYYNSVLVTDTCPSSRALFIYTDSVFDPNSAFHGEIYNNIFDNRAMGLAMCITGNFNSDNNNVFSNGPNMVLIGDSTTMFDWWSYTSTLGRDTNSLNSYTRFVSPNNLHLDQDTALNGKGKPITAVTTDFDGNPRDPNNPDIGADEFSINHCQNVVTNINAQICSGMFYTLPNNTTTDTAGYYTTVLQTTEGCDSIINTTLVVNELPVVNLGEDTTLCSDQSITLDAGNPTAVHSWSVVSINTQTIYLDANIIGMGATTVQVIVTDTNGCQSSDEIVVTFEVCSKINREECKEEISLYPNPAQGKLFIRIPQSVAAENTEIKIFDFTGKLLVEEKFMSLQTAIEMDLANLPAGVYHFRLKNKIAEYNSKIVVQ